MEIKGDITNTALEPPNKLQKGKKKNIWKAYFNLIIKTKLPYFWMAATFVSGIITTKLWMLFPGYSQRLVSGDISKTVLMGISLGTVAWSISFGIEGFIRKVTLAKIDRNLRRLMWATMMKAQIPFFDKNNAREMISRTAKDTEEISGLLVNVMIGWVLSVYTVYLCITELSDYDVRLVIGLLVLFPLVLIITYIFGKLYFNNSVELNKRISKLTQFLSELLTNIPLIKAFSNEEKEEIRGKKIIKALYDVGVKLGIIGSLDITAYWVFSIATTVIIVVLGRYFIVKNIITVDIWVAYYLYGKRLSAILVEQSGVWTAIKSSQGATRRISEIIEDPHAEYNKSIYEKLPDGDIVFEDVCFNYSDRQVLNDVSFTILHGKVTAIVGSSGSGKTTIAGLIERFYSPVSGQIKLRDTNIEDYDLKEWRKAIGYVSQDVPLMSGNIRDNILYGIGREVAEEEFNKVVAAANVMDFAKKFPEGLNKEVGEFGSKLSGGQKQRIAIARALLRNPKFLLLDEATSSLDAASEHFVNEGLENLIAGRTTIVIAHKISTIMKADRIIVVDSGKIDAVGVHEDLLKTSKLYKEFVDIQLRKSVSGKGDH